METASYAVMFTDIKGFTERTSRQTRAENERMLRLHDALLLPVVTGYGGRRVKTIGDAYLCVFDSATRALACGAAMQDRLADYNRRVVEGERILVRVAINAGEVRVEAGDVFGEAVNIASRVEGLAEAGEVCFTEAALLIADRTYFDVEDVGAHELKGIPEPVRIFRLRRGADPAQPYGGTALSPLALAPPSPERLARYRSPLPAGLRRWLVAVPVAAALVALAFFGVSALRGPRGRIEALAASGQLEEARARLAAHQAQGAPVAEVGYLGAVIELADGKKGEALRRLRAAAEADRPYVAEHAGPRLVSLLTDEACEVRSGAARLLGQLRYGDARSELSELAEREPKGGGGFLGKLGLGCSAGDAAREALTQLGAD